MHGSTVLANLRIQNFTMGSVNLSTSSLSFHFYGTGNPASDTFRIFNTTSDPVLFKIQAKPARFFAVRPNGIKIQPNAVVDVAVVRVNRRLNPRDDRLRVLTARIDDASEESVDTTAVEETVTVFYIDVRYFLHPATPGND